VILSKFTPLTLIGWVFALFFAATPIAHAAAQAASTQEPVGLSASGSYLAARHAAQMRDATAASTYYKAALKRDPKNAELLGSAFLALLIDGNVNDASRFAELALKADKNDRIARLVLGVRGLKEKRYAEARHALSQSIHGPITDLTATLLIAWGQFGADDTTGAIASIDQLTGPDWYAIFKELHAGLIHDLAGNEKEAGQRLERAYKLDGSALSVVEAYASWLSRNHSTEEAIAIFETFNKTAPNHPLALEAMKKLKSGEKLPPVVSTSRAGAAEALYDLGASLGRRGGEDLGLVYLQLSLYLAPNHPLTLVALADLFESLKKPELAIHVYGRMPAHSVLRRSADIQMASDLDQLSRSEEAKAHLLALLKRYPDDLEANTALGNVLRGQKKFEECADAYSKAIALLAHPEKSNWVLYYLRGICYERSKQWLKAEVDFKKALELFPDQPNVLNYLGYSWIDQGVHLDDGLAMIKKAVQQRSDDGYIIDSLGWAYFRLGNYDDAVKQLERAIELKPEDPTINDHLGDVYWRIGRELEARFQWTHARDLKPESDELPKIEAKLKNGLLEETSSEAKAGKKVGSGG
jgi:tetratricopeptide (TPR) repeat protein